MLAGYAAQETPEENLQKPQRIPARISERWPTATTVGNHLILELELTATLTSGSSASNSHLEFYFANRTSGLVPFDRFLAYGVLVSEILSEIVGNKTASC